MNPLIFQSFCAPLANTGRLAEAEAAIRKAIELQADDANRSYINLGNVLKLRGRYDESAAAFREAIRLCPTFATSHDGLARALSLKGDYEGAAAALAGSGQGQDVVGRMRPSRPGCVVKPWPGRGPNSSPGARSSRAAILKSETLFARPSRTGRRTPTSPGFATRRH